MVPKTIKEALVKMLDDLSKENFKRFCDLLLDRREEPRVPKNKVEEKSHWEIADVLVSTFTEAKAVEVALEILKQMGCSDEAQKLDSQTKRFRDKGDPTFRRTSDGSLDLQPTVEALTFSAPTALHAKKPEEVVAEAKNQVLSEGGDPNHDRLVLSRCTIQFGKYKGQTFKWLLENDVQYTAWLVNKHQNDRKDPINKVNKESLTQYACAYPDFLKEVKLHANKDLKRHSHRPTTRFGPSSAKKRKTRSTAQRTRGCSTGFPKPMKRTMKNTLRNTDFHPLPRY